RRTIGNRSVRGNPGRRNRGHVAHRQIVTVRPAPVEPTTRRRAVPAPGSPPPRIEAPREVVVEPPLVGEEPALEPHPVRERIAVGGDETVAELHERRMPAVIAVERARRPERSECPDAMRKRSRPGAETDRRRRPVSAERAEGRPERRPRPEITRAEMD